MALPASGAISLNQVNVELGNAGTASINMNSAAVRGLFGVASGAISMSDGYGKSNEFSFSITSNQTNANLRTLAVNAGWDQSIAVVATINSGVRMTSNTVGTPGLTINGAWPGGIELVNNGTIVGRGGNGGNGGNGGTANNSTYDSTNGSAGSAGGLALTISVPVSIRNNGTIAGGGGGGGGGGGYAINVGTSKDENWTKYGGGGGGGGQSSSTNSSGGAGGPSNYLSGSAGGTGTFSAAGNYGAGGTGGTTFGQSTRGGAGGGWGSAGGPGSRYFTGTNAKLGGAGGAAGAATSGQANVTWLATGTRLGPLG
jgi:hypothetical protein